MSSRTGNMNLISLAEYAQKHGISPYTARKRALRGAYETAVKIGRNWVIDADEPHIDHRIDHRTGDQGDGVTGWRKACGWDVYCENGRVLHGIGRDSDGGQITVYPYRAVRGGGWDKDTPPLGTLKRGLNRGNWKMM